MRATPDRLKQAELASGMGADVLGAGLGVLLTANLRPYAVAILVVGRSSTGWGMWDKRRLERSAGRDSVWWDTLLYWVYWGALLGLALRIAWRG